MWGTMAGYQLPPQEEVMWYHVGRHSVIMGSCEGQREAEAYPSEPGYVFVQKLTMVVLRMQRAQKSRQLLDIRKQEHKQLL